MKKNVLFICLVIFLGLFITIISCQKDDEEAPPVKGEGTLAMQVGISSKLKSTGPKPDALIVSIKEEEGAFFKENERLNLLNMNGQYITAPISMASGNYEVSSFMVVDSADNVLYVSPMEGSEMAQFVYDPLPIEFEILAGEVTNLIPEVLAVKDSSAEDFGYLGLSFEVKDLVNVIFTPLYYDSATNSYSIIPVFAYILDENGDTVATNEQTQYDGKKSNHGPFSRSISNLEDNRQNVTLPDNGNDDYSYTVGMSNSDVGYQSETDITLGAAREAENSNQSVDVVLNEPILYRLSVTNGTGDGNYPKNHRIYVTADTPGPDMEFDKWTGDVSQLNDIYSSNTHLFMPTSNVSVTATYKEKEYTLTIVNGSGSGSYTKGTSVTITADPPQDLMEFSHWTIEGTPVDQPETWDVYMPESDITITANYRLSCEWAISGYDIVKIGDQCWMAENMNNSSAGSWPNGSYGKLYTYSAASNICPNGWHLPSDNEWKELEMALGMSQSEANSNGGNRGAGIIDQLMNGGSSGFNALLGGKMSESFEGSAELSEVGSTGYYWTSDELNNNVRRISLHQFETPVDRWHLPTFDKYGASVRCVRNDPF